MDTGKLVVLKEQIENLDAFHHNKILKVLIKNNIKYSENRNGIFVNMNSFDENTINEIKNTLLYITKQEKAYKILKILKKRLIKIILKMIIKKRIHLY